MTDISKELEQFGEVLNFHKTNELIEFKLKLYEDTTKSMIDTFCHEYVESIYSKLICFDIQGNYFKCAYIV